MLSNIFLIFIANISFVAYCIKCLNTIDNFILTIYVLLLFIKSLYFLSKFSNITKIKNIPKINFISTLTFMLIITSYYVKENVHEYKQIGFFIWAWTVQLIFLLILYIEENEKPNN